MQVSLFYISVIKLNAKLLQNKETPYILDRIKLTLSFTDSLGTLTKV